MELATASVGTASPAKVAGGGFVELSRVAGRTVVTRALAHSPLKLLTPRRRGVAGGSPAWVYVSTFGGGLVAGDDIRLSVVANAGTTAVLSTQASTKVYPADAGRTCRQSLHATVGPGAALVVAPDPLTCFAGAAFEQRQRFDLSADASLVLVDWLTSGRRARGERWAFTSYRSRNDIFVGGELLFTDALLLGDRDGPIAGPMRLGPVDCLAAAVVVGPRFAAGCDALQKAIASRQARQWSGRQVLFATSPIRGGVLLRAAGDGPEAVGRWLRDALNFVAAVVGEDPWARKW